MRKYTTPEQYDLEQNAISRTVSKIDTYSRDPDRLTHTIRNVQHQLYTLLTTSPEIAQQLADDPSYAVNIDETEQLNRELYKNYLQKWETIIPSQVAINPAWVQMNCHRPTVNTVDHQAKMYVTIAPNDWKKVLSHLWSLFNLLQPLAQKRDQKLSFKVPSSLSGFRMHNDNLVIYFGNLRMAEFVERIVNNWLNKHDIHQIPRAFDRTSIAQDSDKTSFSEHIAKTMAEERAKGKSASQVVKDTIALSQEEPPTVVRKHYSSDTP